MRIIFFFFFLLIVLTSITLYNHNFCHGPFIIIARVNVRRRAISLCKLIQFIMQFTVCHIHMHVYRILLKNLIGFISLGKLDFQDLKTMWAV